MVVQYGYFTYAPPQQFLTDCDDLIQSDLHFTNRSAHYTYICVCSAARPTLGWLIYLEIIGVMAIINTLPTWLHSCNCSRTRSSIDPI